MKALLAICFVLTSTFAWAEPSTTPAPSAPHVIKGQVLEVQDVDSYTYLRLKTAEGETWAAVGKAPVKEGAEVTIQNTMVMDNFESRELKRTFPTIVFGNLSPMGSAVASAGSPMAMAHPAPAKAMDIGDVQVPKAIGENAWTVAEIISKASELKDKPVLVSGKVVKYNPRIMGKNWIHLRDGSGSEEGGTNDLLVTSVSETKVGDVVTVSGVVRTDKDFGAGYSYKVLIEEATLQQ